MTFFRRARKQTQRLRLESLERRDLMTCDMGADLDGNGSVGFTDFLVMARNFGTSQATPETGDLDGDGAVNFSDFLVLVQNFGCEEEPVEPVELVWGKDDTEPSADWTTPDLLEETTDPAYGTTVRRLTENGEARFDRNTYSRRQAENADGTRFMTYHGSATYHIYSRSSAELVRALDIHPDAEPQWHPTNPDLIRYIVGPNSDVGDLKLMEVNVETGQTRVAADLTDRIKAEIPSAVYMKDKAEGSPDMHGDMHAWAIYDGDEQVVGIVSYSLANDEIVGLMKGVTADYGPLDWVSASATGEYVVAGFWDGTLVFDADLTNQRVINRASDHSDLALDKDGKDAYVYVDFGSQSPTAGWIVSVDLATLERSKMVRLYGGANTSVHISGKGYEKPGWVIVSTYNCKDEGAWSCDKVFALEMAENGRLLNLAHTYNAGEDYWTETHAVVNRDFTRVYFNSDSGSGGIDAEVFEITVPDFE